jgi:hypothetical protein
MSININAIFVVVFFFWKNRKGEFKTSTEDMIVTELKAFNDLLLLYDYTSLWKWQEYVYYCNGYQNSSKITCIKLSK